MSFETDYRELLQRTLDSGIQTRDRTKVGTLSLFAPQIRHSMNDGFPLLTSKQMFWRGIVEELAWYLRGCDFGSTQRLREAGIHIWDSFDGGPAHMFVGPIYGSQWRSWDTGWERKDQLADVIAELQKNPSSRRLIVSAWNVGDLDQMRLPPCPLLFQLYCREGLLSMHVYQRSADLFLGVPFDFAEHALLLEIIAAQVGGLTPNELVFSYGDAHLYLNHLEAAKELLARQPTLLPSVSIALGIELDKYELKHFTLSGYNPRPKINVPIAV